MEDHDEDEEYCLYDEVMEMAIILYGKNPSRIQIDHCLEKVLDKRERVAYARLLKK